MQFWLNQKYLLLKLTYFSSTESYLLDRANDFPRLLFENVMKKEIVLSDDIIQVARGAISHDLNVICQLLLPYTLVHWIRHVLNKIKIFEGVINRSNIFDSSNLLELQLILFLLHLL